MDVPIALLADTAIAAGDGKLSVIGIFDQIKSRNYPAIHPQSALVIRLSASPGERGQKKAVLVRLIDADGAVLLELESEFQVPEKFDDPTRPFGLNQIFQFQGLQIPRAGDYSFYVLVNGEEKARVPFSAVQIGSIEGE
jgi:hypothetical protein